MCVFCRPHYSASYAYLSLICSAFYCYFVFLSREKVKHEHNDKKPYIETKEFNLCLQEIVSIEGLCGVFVYAWRVSHFCPSVEHLPSLENSVDIEIQLISVTLSADRKSAVSDKARWRLLWVRWSILMLADKIHKWLNSILITFYLCFLKISY